ncbi:PREDICTED: uncharacterized protein LOC109180948 isoform X2 [Ipomoea nil]|uniref:uncharacterized protein LOC109180948 isoform X2 n=1 Tax=Ipomoea nil TaxID=35883 RepID=UPI0009016109|nr:PREDICTED: uncharacterized protein LOC109180948 isoform X2 [Ipomoea nil]
MGGTSPDDASSGKCFSGILSRILCSRSLPTHPSDQLPDPDAAKAFFHRRQELSSVNSEANNGRAPGVVARLMGLESMPDLMVSKGRPLGSFLRSRSVNFIDFLPQIGLTTGEAQHRRVRTSMSFREAIGFDKEKHDFLVLCFDSRDETRKEVMPPQKHQVASFPEVKPYKAEKTNQKTLVKKKSTERLTEPPSKRSLEVSVPARRRNPNNVDVNRKESLALKEKRAVKKPVDSRRVSIEPNPNRKKKKSRYVRNNRIQPEYGSILDHPKSSPAKSENSGKLQKSPKKELLKPSNAVQKHMRTADKAFIINDQAPKTVEENVCRARKQETTAGSDEKTLLEICRLAEENASEYWWVGGGGVLRFDDSEEICMHFGQQILDVLLNDVVGELVLMHKSRI